jgi:hypothetical protein
MKMFFSAIALTTAQPVEPVGSWSYVQDWTTEQFGEGQDGYCVTRSRQHSRAGITYTVFMTFGAHNEVGLSSNRSVGNASQGVFDLDGGGLNLGAIEHRRQGNNFIAANSLSKPMFRRMASDLANARNITFQIGGQNYPAALSDAAAVYAGMIECQKSLIGLVIGEL